ncbi:uncharacterized protein LOC105844664 isoform X1 [Hydra vulgaris]|uniref:uncharacterized protein LOC105844664 isoform X1 n=1 Tax=Hydra vulgaris TaxID=6087 RepID=UPI0032EA454C
MCFLVCCESHLLSVYWGQNSNSNVKLTAERSLSEYCNNFNYQIINIAFVEVFFNRNRNALPVINLSDHCYKLTDSESILKCISIGKEIQNCQKKGRLIMISLGGADGVYGFSTLNEAKDFATTIWNLFLGGSSNIRPFGNAVLDGLDLNIEKGSPLYYSDFIQTMRLLMSGDNSKRYYITGAPQCPYPDPYMGPIIVGSVLEKVAKEFDFLYVQFYNNPCFIGSTEFTVALNQWLNFANQIKKQYDKGPLIFIGLLAHPQASNHSEYYSNPNQVEAVYNITKFNKHFGGIMLWDAGFDSVNIISDSYYSSALSKFLTKENNIPLLVDHMVSTNNQVIPPESEKDKIDDKNVFYNNAFHLRVYYLHLFCALFNFICLEK